MRTLPSAPFFKSWLLITLIKKGSPSLGVMHSVRSQILSKKLILVNPEAFSSLNFHSTLVMLLYTDDGALIHQVLLTLGAFVSYPEYRNVIGNMDCIETLLRALYEFDMPLKLAAVDILVELANEPENRAEIKLYDGNTILLNLLGTTEDPRLLCSLLSLSCQMSEDQESCRELRVIGAIPIILNLLESDYMRADRACLIQLCTLLTHLAVDDDNAHQIKHNNGVYLLGSLLLTAGPPAVPSSARYLSGSPIPLDHPDALHIHSFRALRYVFSVERNRKFFKRVFPHDLYSAFIDVGHYVADPAAYLPVVNVLNGLSKKQLEQIRRGLEDINLKNPSKRYVRNYAVIELIGKGAFGNVYKVKKGKGSEFYAMKEIELASLDDVCEGAGPNPPQSGEDGRGAEPDSDPAGPKYKLIDEVRIMSQLNHPNIIKYYDSFVEEDKFYIVMELVEGSSLLDHLNSRAEKGERIGEQKVWHLFVQMCMALKYVHIEKRIVHRDLTPSNVMIDINGQIKIADFGLASQRQNAGSVMESMCGTMMYACPEIVQSRPYTFKADVWSLGCILYQLAMLKAPFAGSNLLVVARRIVEGDYDPLEETYTKRLRRVVVALLEPDPAKRPDMLQVSELIAPVLMDELLQLTLKQRELDGMIEFERRQSQQLRLRTPATPSLSTTYPPNPNPNALSCGCTCGCAACASRGDSQSVNTPTSVSAGGSGVALAGGQPCEALRVQTGASGINTPGTPDGAETPPASGSLSTSPEDYLTRKRGALRDKRAPVLLSVGSGSGTSVGSSAQSTPIANGTASALPTVGATPLGGCSDPLLRAAGSAGSSSSLVGGGVGVSMGSGSTPSLPTPDPEAASTPQILSLRTPPRGRLRGASSGVTANTGGPGAASLPTAIGHVDPSAIGPATWRPKGSDPGSATLAGRSTRARRGVMTSPKVSIARNRLRPIEDPSSQLLNMLRKLLFITELPPTLQRDEKRKLIERYKHALFSKRNQSINLKAELYKLVAGSQDVIDLNLSLSSTPFAVVDPKHRRESRASTLISATHHITYEELADFVEEVLRANGYYEVTHAQTPHTPTAVSSPIPHAHTHMLTPTHSQAHTPDFPCVATAFAAAVENQSSGAGPHAVSRSPARSIPGHSASHRSSV
eukprot:Rmarinus@m.717